MPELPEVETVRIGLAELLPGREIATVDFDWPKSFPNAPADIKSFMTGAKVMVVKRRAKVLLIELSSQYSLVTHLKMTGQLVFRSNNERFGAGHPSESLIGKLPDKSTRVILSFRDGSKLFFNDQRKFGWMRLLPTAEVMNIDFFKKVGPEPLSADFTWQAMRERLMKHKRTTIKAALLDQTVLAGVGNIYADEALWGAKIYPGTPVNRLSPVKFHKLHDELIFVLKLSIEKGGSTDRNYVNAKGKKGSYMAFARVFRREGLACPRCAHIIEKTRIAGRGTHFCP
jgi:formamidopyrimidine-DNA glycosylase